jgi:hypothetical protein
MNYARQLSKNDVSVSLLRIFSLVVCFSGIYLNKLPIGMPHIVFVLGFCFYLYFISRNLQIYKVSAYSFSLLFLYLLLFVGHSNFIAFMNHFSSLLMFPIVVELGKNIKKETILKISVTLIKISVFFLAIECIVRYICATLWSNDSSFYRYKDFSFMFYDTNYAGLAILVLYFFCMYLNIYYNINLSLYKKLLFILCFLTISRTAMLSLLLSLFYFFYNIKNKKAKFKRIVSIRLVLFLCVVCICLIALYDLLYEHFYGLDGSLNTKFKLIESVINLLNSNNEYNILTGFGIGKSSLYLGTYPHNFFLLHMLDTGIVGLAVELLYLIFILNKQKLKGLLIFIPFFIAAQSATPTSVHYLYVILGIIFLLEYDNRINKSNNYKIT